MIVVGFILTMVLSLGIIGTGLIPSLPIVFRFLKDTLAIDASQHHVVDARRAMFSSCSWHKKPTLVELETESSTVYCGVGINLSL